MSATLEKETPQYTKKDFVSNQDVRWCPGCGDYSILTAMQKAMPEMGRRKEEFAIVSGIGCSSRFPYYMNTYGFHTIHGRAPAIATGLKVMNPNLSVWVITGDGDGFSIGGNHMIHAVRRNIGLNIMLFNNAIYGLTKGQASPTSKPGTITKSTPYGSLDNAFEPVPLVISAQVTFAARSADVLLKHLQKTLVQADKHQGTTFIEILQNCHIFNDGVFKNVLDKKIRTDKIIELEHGKQMIFGAKSEKALVLDRDTLSLKTVLIESVDEKDILVHDTTTEDPTMHNLLARLNEPVAMGIIRQLNHKSYEQLLHEQENDVIAQKGEGDLEKLLTSGEIWQV